MATLRLKRLCVRLLIVAALGCVGIALWALPGQEEAGSLSFHGRARNRASKTGRKRHPGVLVPAGRLRIPHRAAGSAARVLSAMHVLKSSGISGASAARKGGKKGSVLMKHSDGLCTNFSAITSLFGTVNSQQPIPKSRLPCHKNLPCDWTPQSFFRPTRIQASLHCGVQSDSISFSEVKAGVTLTSARDKKCLKRILHEHCRGAHHKIPKVAHYVHSGDLNMTVEGFVSVLSVARFLRPCLVLFHGHPMPRGPYWRALLQLVPNILHVPLGKPRGSVNRLVEHVSDVVKLQIVLDYGGVYLDSDYLLLRSLDPLLHHPAVMGTTPTPTTTATKTTTTTHHIGNSFFMGQARAPFLKLCLSSNLTTQESSKQTTQLHFSRKIARLAQESPRMVQVLDSFFASPPGKARSEKLYGAGGRSSRFNWTGSYGFHLHSRVMRKKMKGRPRLDQQDNAVGDMVRHVLHGDASACLHTHT